MILKEGNKNKEIVKNYKGVSYFRYPVKTRTIFQGDNISSLLEEYAGDFLEKGDVVAIAESVIAISQSRAFKFSDIKYGKFAKFLSKFVQKSTRGIGLGTPKTMQLAINEVGIVRILFAAFLSAITKLFHINGVFYRIAGEKARGIDGPTENTLPPYNEYASLLPKNPNKILAQLEKSFSHKEIKFCIVDANDIGVNLIGKYKKDFSTFMKQMFQDNPLGQGNESTPFLVIRKDGK